jgi:hypothetical protein
MRKRQKKTVESIPPDKDQLAILVNLLNDTNGGVRTAAQESLKEIRQNWKNLNLDDRGLKEVKPLKIESGKAVRFAFGTPFSGFLRRAIEQNQYDLKDNLQQGTIVLIETNDVLEVFFYGASGIIINDGGSLSHRCMRLRNIGIPFASIDFETIRDIPDGTFIIE